MSSKVHQQPPPESWEVDEHGCVVAAEGYGYTSGGHLDDLPAPSTWVFLSDLAPDARRRVRLSVKKWELTSGGNRHFYCDFQPQDDYMWDGTGWRKPWFSIQEQGDWKEQYERCDAPRWSVDCEEDFDFENGDTKFRSIKAAMEWCKKTIAARYPPEKWLLSVDCLADAEADFGYLMPDADRPEETPYECNGTHGAPDCGDEECWCIAERRRNADTDPSELGGES